MSWIKSGSNLKLRLVLTVHVCPVDENNINPLLNLCLFVVTQTHEHPSFLSLSLSLPRVSSSSSLLLSGTSLSLSLSPCASFQMFWIWIFVPPEILPPLRSLSLSLSLVCMLSLSFSPSVCSFPSSSLCKWCAAAMSPVCSVFCPGLCGCEEDVWLRSYLLPTPGVAWIHFLYNQYIISSSSFCDFMSVWFIHNESIARLPVREIVFCCSSTSFLPFFFFLFLIRIEDYKVYSKLYRFPRNSRWHSWQWGT